VSFRPNDFESQDDTLALQVCSRMQASAAAEQLRKGRSYLQRDTGQLRQIPGNDCSFNGSPMRSGMCNAHDMPVSYVAQSTTKKD
jgi:hypothetical protein